jgi:hypothetical protein
MVIIIFRPGSSKPAFEPGVGADRPVFVAGVGVYNADPNNSTTVLPPIPVEWIIAPLNATAAQCPSHAATLQTFGIANAIVAGIAILLGCRPIVHFLSRGIFGKRGGSSVKWMWIFTLAFHLLGNLIVSLIIRGTPGYGHLSILNIFALYSARPRASLLAILLLRIFVGVNLRRWTNSEKYSNEVEFVYHQSFRTAAFAELCMQIIASIFIGVTWSRFPNAPAKDWMSGTYKTLEAAPAITLIGIAAFGAFSSRSGEAIPPANNHGYGAYRYSVYQNVWFIRIGAAVLACLLVGFSYLYQWLYFRLFLELPGSL